MKLGRPCKGHEGQRVGYLRFLKPRVRLQLYYTSARASNNLTISPRVQETDSKGWLGALLTCTGLMYAGAVAAVVLMFLYYTGDFTGQCKLHEFFISFNMLVCIALSVISIMPKVQVTLNMIEMIGGSQIITHY